jgi:hypothetical protein
MMKDETETSWRSLAGVGVSETMFLFHELHHWSIRPHTGSWNGPGLLDLAGLLAHPLYQLVWDDHADDLWWHSNLGCGVAQGANVVAEPAARGFGHCAGGRADFKLYWPDPHLHTQPPKREFR